LTARRFSRICASAKGNCSTRASQHRDIRNA
jgi:hypothetical protein